MTETSFIPLTVDLQQILTTDQAWHYAVVPKHTTANQIELYVDEKNWTSHLQDELELLLGKTILLEKTPSAIVQKTLAKYYLRNNTSHRSGENNAAKSLSAKQGDDFLPLLIAEAKRLGSSDIHVETYEERCRVRLRIDGMLVERYTIAKNDYP
ncbi:MAG: GspE/PulE family protein, partial [Bacteroidia bacterium]